MNKKQKPYRLYLTEDQMPKQYYNLRADMKELPEPMLNPITKKEATLEDLLPVFCKELAKQEKEARKKAEIKKQAHEVIAGARFALSQGSVYPDATFTLRLAFGAVKGYEEGGTHIPFSTQIEGMYRHGEEHGFKPPFKLPQSWMDSRQKVDGKTPCNFVCTADIIGGNSGSPVVNREGEFVGLIFDGNIQSLVWDYIYSDRQGRAVSVCSEFILEGLRSVYGSVIMADDILTG